jgi:hypothetical protein
MPLVGFEPTISAGERPQTYDCVANRIANYDLFYITDELLYLIQGNAVALLRVGKLT